MIVANMPRVNKEVKTQPAADATRRQAENMLRDIAFVLKMTAKVKGEILAGR